LEQYHEDGEMNKKIISTLFVAFCLCSPFAAADEIDDDFEEVLFGLCENFTFIFFNDNWTPESLRQLNDLCLNVLLSGVTPSSDYNSSSNIGSSGANGKTSTTSAQVQVDSIQDRLDALQEEEDPESGSWGLLLATQTGETEREDTANEIGYDSDLSGVVIGGDYRFNDRLVTGFAFGNTTDEASFDGDAGELDTTSDSILLYATYIPVDGAYIDGYIGDSKLEFESERDISFTGTAASPADLSGTATGDYDGDQSIYGVSGGYDWYIDNWSIGAFVAIDISETDIDAYEEDGGANPTGLEFSYEKQEIDSETSTVGLNVSYSIDQGWGVLVPMFSISSIHQSDDESREFTFQPAFIPSSSTTPVDQTTIATQTDDPDRNYMLTSIGLVAALNNGTQIFATYEQISSHDFLDVWSFNIGVLIEVF
jgi:outer membrane autotransporter protein